jgi:hypothetical protein
MSAMSDAPARLLSLLSLLQTPRLWPGSELAERLEVGGPPELAAHLRSTAALFQTATAGPDRPATRSP